MPTTKERTHDRLKLKACHYKRAHVPMLWLMHVLHLASHSCTCHLLHCPPSMLTSEEAGHPPTVPAGCDQLDKQPVPSLQPHSGGCDRQETHMAGDTHGPPHTACLIIRPQGGTSERCTESTISSVCCFTSWSMFESVFAWSQAKEQRKCLHDLPLLVLQFLPSHVLWLELGSFCGCSDRRKQK